MSLWTFSVAERKATRFGDLQSTSPFNSEFSPDGRWLAYTLRTSGTANIWVEPFPATGANRYQVTTINGHHPVWLPRGEGLSFRVGNSEQVVVPITVAPSFSIGNPIPVVAGELPVIGVGVSRPYDVTRDGGRFVVVAPAFRGGTGVVSIPEIEIIVNWFEDLKRRVPVP